MIRFEEREGPCDEVDALVRELWWGTPGGVRYSVGHIDWQRVPGIRVLLAFDGDELAGTYGFFPRPWGFYRCMFMVAPGFQGRGLGRALAEEGRARFGERLGDGQVLAGTVELENARSRRSLEAAGYSKVGELQIANLFRRWPRADPRVAHATAAERARIVADLMASGKAWMDADESLVGAEYWVLREGGEAVVGVQACGHRWAFHHLGKGTGPLVHALPLLGIQVSDHRFVTLHHAWGDLTRLSELTESILAHERISAALLCGDVADPDWQQIMQHLRRGPVGWLLGTYGTDILASGPIAGPVSWPPWGAL